MKSRPPPSEQKRRTTDHVPQAGVKLLSRPPAPLLDRVVTDMVSEMPPRRITIAQSIRHPAQMALALRQAVQKILFKHAFIRDELVMNFTEPDAFGFELAARVLFESMSKPEELLTYTRGTEREFRGFFTVGGSEKGPEVRRFKDSLPYTQHELIAHAIEKEEVCLAERRIVHTLNVRDSRARPSQFTITKALEQPEMVIPMLDKRGVVHITGKNLTFGDLIAPTESTLQTARIFARLASLDSKARRDYLTGLFNREELERIYRVLAGDYLNGIYDTAVIMIDIDKFKEVNDQYGHTKGDEALRLVSDCLVKQLRDTDVIGIDLTTLNGRNGNGDQLGSSVARYGGEELVIVLPGITNIQGPITACMRAKKTIQELQLFADSGKKQGRIPLSASFGVTSFQHADFICQAGKLSGFDLAELEKHVKGIREIEQYLGQVLERDGLIKVAKLLADVGVYMAKKMGRNSIVAVGIGERDGEVGLVTPVYK